MFMPEIGWTKGGGGLQEDESMTGLASRRRGSIEDNSSCFIMKDVQKEKPRQVGALSEGA